MNRSRGIPSSRPPIPVNERQNYTASDIKPSVSEVLEHDTGARPHQLAAFGSPTSSTHLLPQPQHAYPASTQQSPIPKHPSENFTYYGNPGPYASPTVSSSYHPSDPDHMAAAHAMRPQVPPNVYHTPQSNSPASVHSPQDHHGRQIFASQTGGVYYTGYPHQSPYLGSHPMLQHPSLAPQPSPYSTSYPQNQGIPQHMQPPQPPPIDLNQRQPHAQQPPRPGSQAGQTQLPSKASSTSRQSHPQDQASSQSANPGPIPATTPLVSKTDANGTQYITFEYSKDRVKVQYEIRCDVESVDLRSLSSAFKEQNCVYPRACSTKEPYRGNRLTYETQCNELGWALANLNEELRGKRGLIQRAVDSWRNSNADPRLRSRRVRRMYKNQKRTANSQQQNQPNQQQLSSIPRTVPPVVQSQTQNLGSAESAHHHQMHGDRTLNSRDSSSVQQQGAQAEAKSPPHLNDVRPIHNFYPTYPIDHSVASSQLPPTYDAFSPVGPRSSATAVTASISAPGTQTDSPNAQDDSYLPSLRNPKHFTIQDRQNSIGVKVKFDIESVNLGDIPPPFRLTNSVYPRSHFARRQLKSPPPPDEGDVGEVGSLPIGKTIVPVHLDDGWESEISIPKMTRTRRIRERIINECGNRITWAQTQSFDRRPLFLAQALNVYRREVRKKFAKDGRPISSHFITRAGKSNWQETPV